MGPEATTKVSIGPDVGAKLTDSVGLVWWADEKVVLLSVREVSETMALKPNVKHFELPLCMKCAIQINLPCLALPMWSY